MSSIPVDSAACCPTPTESRRRSVDEHLAAVQSAVRPLAPKSVPVSAALGHVLARDHEARLAVPPFSNSAMDGFLIRAADAGRELIVVGDVPAGDRSPAPQPGEAYRIMTGAATPEDCSGLIVVPVELCEYTGSHVTCRPESLSLTHIRPAGEDTRPGQRILQRGELVTPGTVAAALSAGLTRLEVVRRPRVSVISSGAELSAASNPSASTASAGQASNGGAALGAASESSRTVTAGAAMIPDSNGPMLVALAHEAGVEQVTRFHSSDDPAEFRRTLDVAAAVSDLIITTGGISAGAYDVVKAVLRETLGAWFGPVAQKPGKPQGLASWNGVPVVCLPGNPVSSFVSFHFYAKSMLRVLAGHRPWNSFAERPRVPVRMVHPPRAGIFVPVHLDWTTQPPTASPFVSGGIGSHRSASLAGCDAIVSATRTAYLLG